MAKEWKLAGNLLWLGTGVMVGWATSKWATWARQRAVQWLWPIGPLSLSRPLVTFDIESTGTNVTKDKIVEIAAIKLMPDGTVLVKGPQRLNPGIPMSDEVVAIHGITAADVAGCPRFEQVAAEWRDFMEGCDLHGYNAKKFDVPILRNELKRSGIHHFPPLGVPVVDSFRLFCSNEPRSLAAAVRFYCGGSHAGAAHTALADAEASLRVLVQQVRRYPRLPRDASGLAAVCAAPSRAQDITGDGKFQWRGDVPILGFGKYAGEPLAVVMSVHKDYLCWMSGQDYSDESLIVVSQALKGLLPTKQGGWEPLVFDTPQQQQQQRQQHELRNGGGSSSSSSSGNHNRGRKGSRQRPTEQQQGSQQAAEAEAVDDAGGLRQQQEPAAAAAAAAAGDDGGGGGDISGSSSGDPSAATTTPAVAAAGWPVLDTGSASEWADNPDSWAAAAAAQGATNSSSSPDGWSIVEPPPQEMPSAERCA